MVTVTEITAIEVRLKLASDIRQVRQSAIHSAQLHELISSLIDIVSGLSREEMPVHTRVAFEVVEYDIRVRRERLAFLLNLQAEYYPEDYERNRL